MTRALDLAGYPVLVHTRFQGVGLPAHVAGGAAGMGGLLRAAGDSLVLYDGSRLLHCADPLQPDPVWQELDDLAGERVVALTSCPDLNGHDSQLFAATASSRLLSWTWPGAGTSDHPVGWYAWQPSDLECRPVALAGWSRGPGHQELVVADTAGDLWARHRRDWESWSPWALIGVVRDVVALDALASAGGSVELYAVTADGELKRKVRDAAATDAGSWSGVETLAGWPQPALSVACWSLAEAEDHQAVLLASGELQQRWRRAGTREWSTWWSTAPAPVPTGVAVLAGWSGSDRRQATAVLGSGGHLCLRPWTEDGGWRPWLPAVQITTLLPTMVLSAAHADRNGSGPGASPGAGDHEDDHGVELLPDRPDAVDPHLLDTFRAEEISRAEEATVLFAGRELLPLLPDDPPQIGPFKLQRRIAGGQASTDKFVARNGRGYCFLKVLRPEATDDEGIAFRRESALAQRVVDRHRLANFIDAYPGDDARPAYLALSFEQGKHLGEVCAGRPLAPEELVVLARSLLEALVELRECRILHLDIKPSNVIMRNGDYPVVVDYGSAVSADTMEVREAAFGTAGYAPPEFASLRAVNPTTDTYSWAAVLIAAATGSTPATDARQRAEQIARLPDQLSELVSTALDEEPANRPTLDAAVRQLTRTQAIGQLGVGVRDRLPVDGLTLIARSEPSPISPRHLVGRLGQLETWQYRLGAAASGVVGVLLGFLVGVFLLQLLRSV